MINPRDLGYAALVLRLMLAINLALHGLTRLPNLQGFARAMADGFESTWMPVQLAYITGFIIPIVEAILGLALLTGFKLRPVLLAAGGLMCMLHFGKGLQQSWDILADQLIYALVIAFLLVAHAHDRFTLDAKLRKQPA